jgi:hypothetical protein
MLLQHDPRPTVGPIYDGAANAVEGAGHGDAWIAGLSLLVTMLLAAGLLIWKLVANQRDDNVTMREQIAAAHATSQELLRETTASLVATKNSMDGLKDDVSDQLKEVRAEVRALQERRPQ